MFEVSEATLERYISTYSEELKGSGYSVLKGKELRKFKEIASGALMNEGTKTTILGIFTFRALLNLSMLLTESDCARVIRSRVLDIVIDVMAQRSGGHTKYINQRDEDYLPAACQEFSYRKDYSGTFLP